MAIDVRVRSHTSLPRGGFNAVGAASNSKAIVTGDIDITSYTASGEPIVAADLELINIDALHVSVLDVDGALPTATNIHNWGYDYAGGLLLLFDGAGGVTDAGTSGQVRFVALGDSALGPELA
jgi:hypothetical protein